MAIATLDGVIGAAKQPISLCKTASRTSVATGWFGTLDLAGNPGAGTLAGSSVAAGVVPTDATAGFPLINAFGGGNTGYLAQIDFGNSVACRMKLVDQLWKAGAYPFNASQALTGQPSYAARVAGGTDYTDTQIWVEGVTAFTGNPTFTITYTNQAGTTGRTATLAAGTAMTVGRRMQVPLQAGDTGIQKIDNVVCTVATVGTFNVLILRPLWTARVRTANDGDTHGWDKTGGTVVYDTSALEMMIAADSTATGIPELYLTIANG